MLYPSVGIPAVPDSVPEVEMQWLRSPRALQPPAAFGEKELEQDMLSSDAVELSTVAMRRPSILAGKSFKQNRRRRRAASESVLGS